ncbi:hypothetical protein [Streptomyces sp. UNOC14_S4]|uniref:hypothetical protein n=1 Tax=Streptomyces sp. UNOC14_S4 TaxID=2872340 RepID=UPI001E33EB79|nr:hypothetical protein [Streptomyces sp. UNOC14_S4]MCC3766030.1 hypothetical protein [Streptomyces sp. UNOC14_S4]
MTDLGITDAASATAFGSSPTLGVKIPAMSAEVTAGFKGSAQLFGASAFGGFTDFGFAAFGNTRAGRRIPWVDPVSAMTLGHGIVDATDGWRRTFLTATVPQGRNTGVTNSSYRGAAYAALAVRLPNLPKGATPQLSAVMVERHTGSNLLHADAAYHLRAVCYTGTCCDVTLSADLVLVGNRSLRCTVTNPAGPAIGPTPTFAALAKLPDNAPPLTLSASVATSFAETFTLVGTFYDALGNALSSTDGSKKFTTPGGYGWANATLDVTPPPAAVYASVVPSVRPSATLQVGENIYTAAFGVRYQSLTAPRPGKNGYRPARHMYINLLANRINLARNPSLTSNTPATWRTYTPEGDGPTVITQAVGRTRPGAGDFRATPSSPEAVHPDGTRIGIGSSVSPQPSSTALELIHVGRQHTLSAYIRETPGNTLPVHAFVRVTQEIPGKGTVATVHRGISTTDVRAQHPEHTDGEWVRVWITFTPPPGSSRWVTAWFGPPVEDFTGSTVSSFQLDDVLLEEAGILQPYFDGAAHHPDYLWEDTGPAAGDSGEHTRSHLYRERRSLQRRLAENLDAHIQHGTPYDLRYATAPTADQSEALPPLPGKPGASTPAVPGVRATQVASRSAVVAWTSHTDTGRSIVVRVPGRADTVRPPALGGVYLSGLEPENLHHITVLRRDDATGAESAPATVTVHTRRTAWPEGLLNLAADPSFEASGQPSSGQVGRWTVNRETSPTGLFLDTQTALLGSASLRLDSRGDGQSYGITMWPHRRPVVPGQQWTFSAWVRTSTARPAGIWIRWWAEGGTTDVSITDAAASLPANTWTYLTVSGTVPDGADSAFGHVHFPKHAPGEAYWVDGASFTSTPSAVEYADGGTAGWEWIGTDADRTARYIGLPGERVTPSRLQITDIGAYSATIKWDPANPSNAKRDIIIRQGTQVIAEVPKTVGFKRLTGLRPRTGYTYTVTQRYDDGQESGPLTLTLTTQPDTWTKGLTNYAPNPGFEYGTLTGNSLGPWSTDTPGSTIELSTTAPIGTRSLALHGRTGATVALHHSAAPAATAEGESWTASGWVRSTASSTARITLRWQNATGADVLLQQGQSLPLAPGEWQRLTVSGKTPVTATRVSMMAVFENQVDGESCHVDAVMLTKTPSTVEYADGDTPGWRWNSDPGATSTSTYADDGAPPAPFGLTALRTSEKDVSITWGQPPADRALTARVWLSGQKQWEGDAATRSLRLAGLQPSTTYTIEVAYYDPARDKESPRSALTVTTSPAKWPLGLVNWAPDPGFEYLKRDSNGLIGGVWTLNRDSRITELDINTTSGEHYLQYTARDNAAVAVTHNPKRIPVQPGQPWTASAFVLPYTADRKCSIVMIWWDKDGKELPHTDMTPQLLPKLKWSRISYTDTAPAGATEMYVMYRIGDFAEPTKKGELYYLDNLMITPGSTVHPWASGDTEDWEWIGGPGGTSRYKGWPGAEQPAKGA